MRVVDFAKRLGRRYSVFLAGTYAGGSAWRDVDIDRGVHGRPSGRADVSPGIAGVG